MSDHDQSKHEPTPTAGFWKSRTGVTLIAVLAVAALLLGFEHRIHIFTGNGLAAAVLLGFIVMHLFMHGGHGGGHGRHGRGDKS